MAGVYGNIVLREYAKKYNYENDLVRQEELPRKKTKTQLEKERNKKEIEDMINSPDNIKGGYNEKDN